MYRRTLICIRIAVALMVAVFMLTKSAYAVGRGQSYALSTYVPVEDSTPITVHKKAVAHTVRRRVHITRIFYHHGRRVVRHTVRFVPVLATEAPPVTEEPVPSYDQHIGKGYVAPPVGSDLLVTAFAHLGQGNFIGLPGAWCADFISFVLKATGHPPLENRMAAAALNYGQRVPSAQPGDLVVVRTRRGPYGHVGMVVADNGRTVRMISGNWSHRVKVAVISRGTVTAFIRPYWKGTS